VLWCPWCEVGMPDENKVDLSKVLAPLSLEQIKSLKKGELAELLFHEQNLRLQFQSFYNEARAANVELQEKRLLLQEQYVLLKNQFFAKSSERSPRPKPESSKDPKRKKKKKKKNQKPSERYPDIPLIERDLKLETPPTCELCRVSMIDSGMVESCEFLTVIPMQFAVIDKTATNTVVQSVTEISKQLQPRRGSVLAPRTVTR